MIDSIHAVMVFYNPSQEQVENANRISQFVKLTCVDNSSIPLNCGVQFDYIPLNGNKGIAYAQNIGINVVQKGEWDYILFLDQDSEITDVELDKLYNTYLEIQKQNHKIAALGPIIINKRTHVPYKNRLNEKEYSIVSSIISSGSIVSVTALKAVGLMESSLFIDVVDQEWCWRCKKCGYDIYMTNRSALYHEVGNSYTKVLGLQFILSAPFRYFYKYRNSLVMMTRSYVPFSWKWRTLLRLIFEYVVFGIWAITDKSKKSYFQNASSGIINSFKYEKK